MFKVRDAGITRTITGMLVKHAGSTRRVKSVKVMQGGTLRTVAQFASTLSASVTPSAVVGGAASNFPATVTTQTATATPSGGAAPYTYSWVNVSGYGSINRPTQAGTSFTATVPTGTFHGVFRVTITDAIGQTATADVTASFTNYGGGGPIP